LGAAVWEEVMTVDIAELRRLHGAATAGFFVDKRAFSTALHNAAPALLDAADELARVKAVLAGDEAVERVARAWHPILFMGLGDDKCGPVTAGYRKEARYNATAALAALRELIARDE
jgi:hypothetical protein